MALQKFGDAEEAHVFRGKEASVVNEHMQRLGKAVSDFNQDEKAALDAQLESVREEEEVEQAEAAPEAPRDEEKAQVKSPENSTPEELQKVDKKGVAGKKLGTRKDGNGE